MTSHPEKQCCHKCEYSHKANEGHKGFVCECQCHTAQQEVCGELQITNPEHHLSMAAYFIRCKNPKPCRIHPSQPQQEGWERDFDRAFGVQATAAVDGTPCEGFFYEDGESRRPAPERIKSFIRTLLTSATREARRDELRMLLKDNKVMSGTELDTHIRNRFRHLI